MKKLKVLYIDHCIGVPHGASRSLYDMILSLEKWVEPIVLLHGYGELYNWLTDRKINCIVCNFTSQMRDDRFWRFILLFIPTFFKRWWINRKCVNYVHHLQLNLDLVHTNSIITDIGAKIAKKEHVAHVWHIREMIGKGTQINVFPFWGWNKLYNTLSKTNRTIAISKAVSDYYSLNKNNTSIILDAVRSVNELEYVENKGNYFLFCSGSLAKNKGADDAMIAFCKSGLAQKGVRLKFIGRSGAYRKKLDDIAEKNHVLQNIDYLEYQNDVRPFFLNALGFLMCSHHEALGRVSVEAMFYGCPVIARNDGGTVDFVKNRYNGLLFNNSDEMAFEMNEIYSNNKLAYMLSHNAMKTAAELFSIENYGKRIYDIYQEVIEK